MKKLLAFFIFFLAILLTLRGWWQSQLAPVSSDKIEKTIIIAKGQSFSETSGKLQKEGLIKSALVFKLLARQKGLEDKIQAGTFKLSSSMSSEEVLRVLIGQPLEVWVTLLEGWRVEEMGEKLSSDFSINNEEFLVSAKEGYMFPDTYLFPHDVTVEQIIQTLRDNFDKKYSEELKAKVKKRGLTEEEGVVLASLVEREARSDEARKMVASILLHRLNIGMKLDVDATVQYALGYQKREKSWWKRHITKEDKEIKSPYNTYRNPGLPAKPIANPSLSSLTAVAEADPETPYLYYYHDSKGKSHYATSLEEHLENVADNP